MARSGLKTLLREFIVWKDPETGLSCVVDGRQRVRHTLEANTLARQLASLTPDEQREKVRELEVATAGTRGHEKSRRQRQVLGETKPRMKSRKDITSALATASGEYAAALRWVLGEEETE